MTGPLDRTKRRKGIKMDEAKDQGMVGRRTEQEGSQTPSSGMMIMKMNNPVNDKPAEVIWVDLKDSLAGRRKDADPDYMRVYVDPLCELGWIPMIVLHETVEHLKMAKGISYREAHHLATQAENAYCVRHGISWDEYNNGYHLKLRKIEHRDPRPEHPVDIFNGDGEDTEKGLIDEEHRESPILSTGTVIIDNPVTHVPTEVTWIELNDGLAGRRKDCSVDRVRVYVDPLCELGWIPMILLHETVELINMAEGISYTKAHHLATQAEKAYCKEHGISWDEYNNGYHLKLRKIEHRGAKLKDPVDMFNGAGGDTEKGLIDEEGKALDIRNGDS
jgi:hypothetical protein